MSDIERQIADFLHEEANRPAPSSGMYERVLRRAKVRKMVTATVAGLAVFAVVIAGVVTAGTLRAPSSIKSAGPGASPQPSATPPETGDCRRTIPPQPGFVPPKPYPPQPPEREKAVWYGSAALWTMLSPEGETWDEFPPDSGRFTDKTLWWSDGYSWTEEPTPSIRVTGQRLDGPGSFEAEGPVTNGFREDMGSFMLGGIEIPTAGCWKLTAKYRDAELSYVVLVKR